MLSPMRLANDYDIDIITGLIRAKDTSILKFHILSDKGYFYESINSIRYYAHHIIYFWATGTNPKFIKHKDGNKINNSINNLCTLQPPKINRYLIKQVHINNLISYYEEEKEKPNTKSSITQQPLPGKAIKPNTLIKDEIIINADYSTKRTGKGNWSLRYKGKHISYQPSYEEILKYIKRIDPDFIPNLYV